MIRKNKPTLRIIFSLLIAATVFFTSISVPVSAESQGKTGVHADISTFEKNFSLTPAQKKYCINECERVVERFLDPNMSDLEKYYRLALWENERASYDYQFWHNGYHMEYYRHQWDAYGVLTDKSVCAGMAIFYSNLCHAADLPCKFVRTDPTILDHTINYIPDINGNAYYVDVTEGDFIMSKDTCTFAEDVDKAFAYITKDCTDNSFEYTETYTDDETEEDSSDKEPDETAKKEYYKDLKEESEDSSGDDYSHLSTIGISECFRISYADWFKEYALHEDTDKDFRTPYVEKGSGTRGVHYASYSDYPKQFSATEKPGIWFLEDFYKDPEAIRKKILNREFDEQLLDISGIEDSYDCNSSAELESAIGNNIEIEYFPSSDEGEIVSTEAYLIKDLDFTVTCNSFDKSKGQAVLTIKGIGDYTGTYQKTVKLTSAAVKKAANPMTLKAKLATVKYSKVKKKTQTIKRAKAVTVSKAKGKLSYKYVSAKKGKKSFKKYFKINAKTGNVTVKKGLKKGTYKVKVKVKAAGNTSYKASSWKTVTFRVRVK